METRINFVFHVKQWLDREQFNKLLTFSRFIERSKSEGSKFEIDIQRILRNKVKIEDIVTTLSSVGVELDEKEIKELSELILKSAPEFDIEFYKKQDDSNIIVKLNIFIPDLKELNIPLKYDGENKVYIIYPYHYNLLKGKLKEKGYKVKELDLNFQDLNIDFKGSLRDYQREAVEKWKENNYNGVIALPTGAGKTIIGINALSEVKKPTLIVTFTTEQMMQWRDKIIEFANISSEDVGLFYSEEKEIKPITITTYQTAFRHMKELGDKFDLLIIDEVHHLPAEKFKQIALNSIASKRLGLSATPHRDDGKHEELFELMGGLVYHKTPQELTEKGYLAPFELIHVSVELLPEEKKIYEDLRTKYQALAGRRSVSQLLEDMRSGDKSAKEALKIFNQMKKAFSITESKLIVIEQILEKEAGNKVLIFTQYVDQAEEIANRFNAYLLTGGVKKKEREKILNEFKQKKEGILVLTTVGDEGLDIPDANVGIIVAGTGSRRQFVQRLGRLLRQKDGKVARLYEIVAKDTLEEQLSEKRKSTDIDLN